MSIIKNKFDIYILINKWCFRLIHDTFSLKKNWFSNFVKRDSSLKLINQYSL